MSRNLRVMPNDNPRGSMEYPLFEKLRAYLYVEPVGEAEIPAKRRAFVRGGILCRLRWGRPPDAWKRRPKLGEFRVWYGLDAPDYTLEPESLGMNDAVDLL